MNSRKQGSAISLSTVKSLIETWLRINKVILDDEDVEMTIIGLEVNPVKLQLTITKEVNTWTNGA